MAPPFGDGWWKCCQCDREIEVAVHGDEKCPDCEHDKCEYCEDPFDCPSDWADLSMTQSRSSGAIDNGAGPEPGDEGLIGDDTAVIWAAELEKVVEVLQTGSLVDSELSLK
jgi:hypothetical protein